jgi:hypothetical protein
MGFVESTCKEPESRKDGEAKDTDFRGYLESSFLLFSLPHSTAVYENTYLNFRYYVFHHP